MNGSAAARRDRLHPGAGARREYLKLPRDLAILTRSFGIELPAEVQRDATILTFSIECTDRLLDAIPGAERRARFSASVVSCLRGEGPFPAFKAHWDSKPVRDGAGRRPRRVQRRNGSARCFAGGDIAARCPYQRKVQGNSFITEDLTPEVTGWLAQLREVAQRRRVHDALCEIARSLFDNSEVMRTTTRAGEFIQCAVREGRLMVELLLLILADVSTPRFDRFMRRLSGPANLIDKLRDAVADFRAGEIALRPTPGFRLRLLFEILRRTFALGLRHATNGRLFGWGIQSLFTELIWFRHPKAHSH